MRQVVLILIVLGLFGVFGCQSAGPTVMVRLPGGESDLSGEYSEAAVEVGRFVVGSNEYGYSGEYVKQCLAKKIAVQGLETGGKVMVVYGVVEFDFNNSGGDSVEVKFEMADRAGGYTLGAAALREKLLRRDDEYVRKILAEMVGEFWDKVWPMGKTIAVDMCQGWSEYDKRGRKLAKQGDYAGALAELRRAIDARPDDHAAIYNAGVACEAMGNYGQAKDYYRRALRLKRESVYEAGLERVERAVNR